MKTCLITGAGSGIGRASAIEVAKLKEFNNIVLIGRRKDKLEETANLISENLNIHIIPFDLEELDKIPKIVKNIYETCGSIDCLLNIAGYTEPQPLLATSLNNMKKTYSVNVFAPFMLTRECI